MPTPSTLGLFAVAALALLVIPGPSVLYVVTRSIEQGRRAGLVSVLGLHTGTLVHIAAVVTGLSALLLASATLFDVVKLAGAAYLLVLGISRLARKATPTDRTLAPASYGRIYRQGFVVNVLNPKTALFFVAFFPQFVANGRGPVAVQILVLGALFILLGLCSDSTYALVAGTVGARLRVRARAHGPRRQWSGLVLVGLGVAAAATRRPAPAT
ncbi:MAG TPA: LysE family translocator [Acidimicrobiales bacterium]|jgi:threonine/homoserine/homoserine lactone efflux protein|nr:LysE family translocator [Acidimicrobiales bacterium]